MAITVFDMAYNCMTLSADVLLMQIWAVSTIEGPAAMHMSLARGVPLCARDMFFVQFNAYINHSYKG